MSRPLPRYINTTLADQRKVDKAVGDSEDRTVTTVARATLAGDERRLRGIPVVGRGISGGENPLVVLLGKERAA